jgi:hypothetical protein
MGKPDSKEQTIGCNHVAIIVARQGHGLASAARSSTSLAWTVASTFRVGLGIGVSTVIEVGCGVPPHAATHRIINTHTRANAVLRLIPSVIEAPLGRV